MGHLHSICISEFSFAANVCSNPRVKDAGHPWPNFVIHATLPHRKAAQLLQQDPTTYKLKNIDSFFHNEVLFKLNKVINTLQIFPEAPHPVPPAKQHWK